MENLLLYGTFGVAAVIIGLVVAGAVVMIAMAIELADDVKKNGW